MVQFNVQLDNFYLIGRELVSEHEEDGAPPGAGGSPPFIHPETCPGGDRAVSGASVRNDRRIDAATHVSAHLNRIQQNKTPPSQKDGVCQQP